MAEVAHYAQAGGGSPHRRYEIGVVGQNFQIRVRRSGAASAAATAPPGGFLGAQDHCANG